MPLTWLKSGSIVLPPLPVWPRELPLRLCNFLELKKHLPAVPISAPKDNHFILVPHTLLPAAIAWALTARTAFVRGFTPESGDCDDFVDWLDVVVSLMAAAAGIEANPLLGCLTVRQDIPWAGVPAGGTHAVAAVLTSEGLQIVDAQSGTTVPLAQYPNRNAILFGDRF